ncbi:MAG: 2OG-Fe(II) oxygenase family protein [Candidatus Lustribacter sp.]|jgi:isopenicillin N synthase-like dioxygenase
METLTGIGRKAIAELPIIDVSAFVKGGSSAERSAVAAQLREACINIGFFYIVGHAISAAELDDALGWSHRFFALPLEDKLSISSAKSAIGHGYLQVGGLNSVAAPDIKERVVMSREHLAGEPADGNYNAGKSQWPKPDLLPGFEDFMKSYIRKCSDLARVLARVLAASLHLDEAFFDGMFRYLGANLILNYYPPVDRTKLQENQWSFSPHTDYGAFTILLQDAVGGLQAKNSAGRWIDVPPIRNAFVVNIGDMLAMWTNDLYMSTLHRALNLAGAPRVSLPFFTYPNGTTPIRCLPTCHDPANPPRYDEIVAEEYVAMLTRNVTQTGKPGISQRNAQRLQGG